MLVNVLHSNYTHIICKNTFIHIYGLPCDILVQAYIHCVLIKYIYPTKLPFFLYKISKTLLLAVRNVQYAVIIESQPTAAAHTELLTGT